MKYSHLFIPGLLLAFNAHASNPSEEFKDTTKKSGSQFPTILSSQIQTSISQETSDSNEESSISPRSQRIADTAEANAVAQMAEQRNKNLKKQLEEKKLKAAQAKQQKQLEEEKLKEAQQQKILEALQKRIAVEKQQEQQLLAELAALDAELAASEADKSSTLQKSTTVTHTTQKPTSSEPTLEQLLRMYSLDETSKSSHQQILSKDQIVREQQQILDELASQKANKNVNNNNQNVFNTNSAIVVSSAGSQYNPAYMSDGKLSASFSDFGSDKKDTAFEPAVQSLTAVMVEDDNNQNAQPVVHAPVVTSIENENVPIAKNVNNNQPGQTESNLDRPRNNNFTGENVLREVMGDEYNPKKSNWVNLTSFFRND